MVIQSTIFTYAIVGAFYIVMTAALAALWRANRTQPKAKWMIGSMAVVVLIAPWAEEVWIAYHFADACEEAGIHVKRQVTVDGFYDTTASDSSTQDKIYEDWRAVERMEKSGFQYIERRTSENKTRHLEVKDGKIEQTILDQAKSRYHFLHTHKHAWIGHKIKKHQRVVLDHQTNEVIGRDITYARYPAFIDLLWIRFFGGGVTPTLCNRPVGSPKKPYLGPLTEQVFIPR